MQIINDPLARIFQVLTDADLDGSVCLRFIDRYGDTTFNRLQMPILLQEMKSVSYLAEGETCNYLQTITMMIESYLDEPHVYVKFIGD